MRKFKPVFYATLIIIALIGVVIVQGKQKRNLKQDNVRISNNLKAVTFKYITKNNTLATQSQALEIEIKDLRKVNKIADELLSDYERAIKKAYQVIDNQKKKLKEIESINLITLEATGTDTVFYEISKVDTFYTINISDFDDGYLKAYFKAIDGINLKVDYIYSDEVNITVTREKDVKDKRFFLFRWIKPKFNYYSTASTKNPNAEITVNDYIIMK